MARYPFALACVAAAAGAVAVVDVMLALTPLVLFAVAVAASAARGGTKPGLLAAGLAALLSNYLFVAPRYELSFDWQVARLVALYLASVPVARYATTRLRGVRTGPAPEAVGWSSSAGTAWLVPLLAGTCVLSVVAVPLLMNGHGRTAPAPAAALPAAVFVTAAAWARWRGR